jgi:peptidoglycan/xylan/chitin deacetylase (PgdA/CDA1 family)
MKKKAAIGESTLRKKWSIIFIVAGVLSLIFGCISLTAEKLEKGRTLPNAGPNKEHTIQKIVIKPQPSNLHEASPKQPTAKKSIVHSSKTPTEQPTQLAASKSKATHVTQASKTKKFLAPAKVASSKKRVAYLTFDDGPNTNTTRLLGILDHYHVKATFFMLNNNMLSQQKAVKKMASEGFGLGCHGVTHQVSKFYHSPASAYGEMKTCLATLKKITHKTSIMIRTPYGSVPYMKAPYRKIMSQHGYHMWDWNVDSLDWKFLNGPKTAQYTISQIAALKKRGITPVILMHDKSTTSDAVPAIIRYLKANGYEMKAITNSLTPLNFWNHHQL